MPAARFCSECGEQIKAKKLLLPFRSFCRHCSPGLRSGRLILAAALAACTAIGFTVGRYVSDHEPVLLIGTPVEVNANPVSERELRHAPPNESVTVEESSGLRMLAGDSICGAPTKSGKPCQRKVRGGGYCWQHRDKLRESKATPAPP